MEASRKWYRGVCLIGLGLMTGCSSTNLPVANTTTNLDPWTQLQVNLEEVGTGLKEDDGKIEIQNILQGETSLYTTGELTYPVVDYGTRRSTLFGQYRDGAYQTGDTLTLPVSDQAVTLVAVAEGRILQITQSTSLGQFAVLEFVYAGVTYHMIYSQLGDAVMAAKVGDTVTVGQTIATITATEQRNLHFAVYLFSGIELFAGQVPTLPELQLWVDPFDFLRQPEIN